MNRCVRGGSHDVTEIPFHAHGHTLHPVHRVRIAGRLCRDLVVRLDDQDRANALDWDISASWASGTCCR